MAAVLPKENREQAKQAAIEHLASELGIPQPEVGRVYEQELDKLGAHAKVKDFLPLLVERRVKESLRVHHRSQ